MHATDFVHSYFRAWNHRDPVAVAGHLTRDGTYTDVPQNIQRSRDELIVSLEQFFEDYDQHRYELIGEILVGRHTIAFQYAMALPGDPDSGESYATQRPSGENEAGHSLNGVSISWMGSPFPETGNAMRSSALLCFGISWPYRMYLPSGDQS